MEKLTCSGYEVEQDRSFSRSDLCPSCRTVVDYKVDDRAGIMASYGSGTGIGPRTVRSVYDSAYFGIGPGPDDLSVAASGYGYDDYYCCDTGVDPATLFALLAGKSAPNDSNE